MMIRLIFVAAMLFAAPAALAQDIAVSLNCGGPKLAIECSGPGGANDCSSTAVRLSDAKGGSRLLPEPNEFSSSGEDVTAVGLACATARDGKSYFVVEYGGLPTGCNGCEWLAVLDSSGRALTRNNPPWAVSGEAPNNREFEALVRKLGLKVDERTYAECDTDRSRSARNPPCVLRR